MSELECRVLRDDAEHLLNCPSCRARVRVEAAWKALPPPQSTERAIEPREKFLSAVTAAIRRDRARRTRIRYALAAAAALLFFFCVGTGHEAASLTQASPVDAYGSLVTPGELSGLIPN